MPSPSLRRARSALPRAPQDVPRSAVDRLRAPRGWSRSSPPPFGAAVRRLAPDIPWDKGTHLNYAFAHIDGSNPLNKFKKQHPDVKTLISVGGSAKTGGYFDDKGTRVNSGGFYSMATNADRNCTRGFKNVTDGEESPAVSNPMWHAKNLEKRSVGDYVTKYGFTADTKLTGTYARRYDSTLVAPWLWNAEKKVFLSTEDEQSVNAKTDYVVKHGIGGAMCEPAPTRPAPASVVEPGAGTPSPCPTSSSGDSPGQCAVPAWTATTEYGGGNTVSHKGHSWKAKWWTKGEEPGTTGEWGVWQDLGAC